MVCYRRSSLIFNYSGRNYTRGKYDAQIPPYYDTRSSFQSRGTLGRYLKTSYPTLCPIPLRLQNGTKIFVAWCVVPFLIPFSLSVSLFSFSPFSPFLVPGSYSFPKLSLRKGSCLRAVLAPCSLSLSLSPYHEDIEDLHGWSVVAEERGTTQRMRRYLDGGTRSLLALWPFL